MKENNDRPLPRVRRTWRHRVAALGSALALAVTGTVVAAPQPAAAAAPNYDGDPTQYWNQVLVDVFRQLNGPDAAPGRLARAAAMMNAAIFDAETMYRDQWRTRLYQPYLQAGRYFSLGETDHEEERVIGRTAYNILLDLFGTATLHSPSMTNLLDQRFTHRFGTSPTDFDYLDLQVVSSVVQRMRQFRSDDRSTDSTVYTPSPERGAWRPTGDPSCTAAQNAVTPNWGRVKPFSMTSGSQFRRPTPEQAVTYDQLLQTTEYQRQVDLVRRFGGAADTAKTKLERTTPQTAAALFWANDVDDTYRPVGQLLVHTGQVARQLNVTSPYENARLYTLVSLALADAAIAAWDTKYETRIDLWRPESAIREIDPDWRPLSVDRNGNHFSPCFPSWVSGHATFAGAWAGIMTRFFDGNATFTVDTEDPSAPVKSKTFTSFAQAAQENAQSRLWLGVHYPWDADDGMAIGDAIAGHVFTNELTELPTTPR
ncbi:vanadium-dependent haloperoxidase [[Actinomadura] parvosata]|uniref:vanadium-dependent haloperoxidase n=1 Tax=[Actinomadura] parvosata TaxID=1955412 RepID=UPI00406C54A2